MTGQAEGFTTAAGASLEEGIAEWRAYLRRRPGIHAADVDELEDHLRSQVQALQHAGLSEEEAFLIAVKRLGELDAISREFAREHSERLWKRLVLGADGAREGRPAHRDAALALALAVAAAAAVKLPELFGVPMRFDEELPTFYIRNASLFVLPFLAALFACTRALGPGHWVRLALPFAVGAAVINAMPFAARGHTELLAALHLPIALWFAVGAAYAGGRFREHGARMNFLRFSGEWFIYYTLIALGGWVLLALSAFVFGAIGLRPEPWLVTWVLPCGAAGAVLVAAWLVEAKQGLIETMAPVLTLLFTPLFALMLLAFLLTMAWTGSGVAVEREVLIGFDLLLVVVAGLVLYTVSARDPARPAGVFDVLQLVLLASAVLVDAVALTAMAGRISSFGASPNKMAALGENLVLLVGLGWSALLYARFLLGRVPFAAIERWQTAYLPVYAAWAWVVVVVFPPLFGFR